MALGFKLPEVKFLSITLDGGTDLLKKTDEPHTAQEGDSLFTGVVSNASGDLNQAPEPMKVDVILGVQVAFDVTSGNIYSSFFKNDFAKYLKLRILQSTNYLSTQTILADPRAYLKPGGLYHFNAEGVNPDNPGLGYKDINMSDFDGLQPELAPDTAFSVEVKYDSSGNKIYIFPYKFQFEVPPSNGGVKADHLTYFTYAYIDIDKIKTEESLFGDIELPKTIVDKLSAGKIAFQQVVQGGTINNFSQVFYRTPGGGAGDPDLIENFPPLFDENGNIIGKDYTANKNALWTGPVHYHGPENPGPKGYIGYMAGVVGNDMGPLLTAVPIQNSIIQDFREIKELEKISFDYSLFSNSWFNQKTTEKLQNNINGLKKLADRDNPYLKDTDDIEMAIVKSLSNSKNTSVFGDFYSAMDGSGNTRYGFNINIKEAIKQNTVFPKLVDFLFETSEDSVDELLDQKLIKELKIYRHRVYEENPADPSVDIYEEILNDHPKLVVATAENTDGLLLAKQEYSSALKKVVGAIKQEDIHLIYNSNLGMKPGTQLKTIKFYTGTDLQTPIDGDYIYSIELDIKDPIIGWMKNRIDELEEILVQFKIYNNICQEDPEYYNNYTNRFSQKGIDRLEYIFGTEGFIYNEILKYFGILEKFSSFDELTYGAFNLLTTISSANYGNPSGVQTTLRVMEGIYSKILKVFSSASKYKKPVDAPQVGADGKGQSVYLAAGSNPRRDFIIKHKFNTEIKGEIDHLTAYDYLSMQNTKQEDTPFASGLKSMSFAEYDIRISRETSKLTSADADEQAQLGIAENQVLYLQNETKIIQEVVNVLKYILFELYPSEPTIGYIAFLTGTGFPFENRPEQIIPLLEEGGWTPNLLPGSVVSLGGEGSEFEDFFQAYIYVNNKLIQFKKDLAQAIKQKNIASGEIQSLQSFPINIGGIDNIPVLNPVDSIHFTKYAYLSPSLVNFSDSDSTNLLNNGTIVTDVGKLNNTLLNIVKYNTKSGQTLDFPKALVATGVGNSLQDKIIPQSLDNELKYDLLNLMSLRQATVSSNEVSQNTNSTKAGGVIGGSTATDMARIDSDVLSTLYELPDSQKNYGLVDIFTSANDPTDMLLAATEQSHFNILSDPKWTWEYYVENFDETFYQEYSSWYGVAVDPNPYTFNNSPLKRAPNHVKTLMVLLNWKNNVTSDAFDVLKGYLKANKPYAYNYDIPKDQIGFTDSSNFFGVTSKAYEINGLISYNKIYPKNKVIYQTPEFLSFFLLNYKNIVKIEFLAGYKDDNVNDPIWKELTKEYTDIYKKLNKNILCRMVPYENDLYGVKRYHFMKLPVYNEHFIIRFDQQEQVETSPLVEQSKREEDRVVGVITVGEEEIPLVTSNQGPRSSKRGTFDPRNSDLPTHDGGERAEDVNQEPPLVMNGVGGESTTISSPNQAGDSFEAPRDDGDTNQVEGGTSSSPIPAPGVINYNY